MLGKYYKRPSFYYGILISLIETNNFMKMNEMTKNTEKMSGIRMVLCSKQENNNNSNSNHHHQTHVLQKKFSKKKLIFRRIETHWFWFYSSYRKGDRQVIMLTERTIPDKTVYTIYLKNAPSKRNGIVFVAVFCCCCCCLFFSVFLLVISCVYPSVVQAEKFENAFESGNRGKCETHEPHQTEDRDKEEEIEKRNEKHSENTEQQYQ